jgi:primosomal protein N' (replication factor Y)
MSEFADVALHLPIDRLFTYQLPASLRGRLEPGMRVRVPFQSRSVTGTCVAMRDEAPGFDTRPIQALIGDRPVFTPTLLRLCSFVAKRYAASPGEALDAALPAAVRSGQASRTVPCVRLAVTKDVAMREVLALQEKFEKQARTLRHLADAGEPLEVRRLLSLAKVGESPLESLGKRGLVERFARSPNADPLDVPAQREAEKDLTAEQASALDRIAGAIDTQRSQGFLLFGVTGSGKTEIYLQALKRVVAQGRQGIVLVPEIALTPQTVARFKARFPRVAVLHSNLTDADRHRQWRSIHGGEIDVVVGARSAIFAPLPRLGLIVIDEEHEGTFKQQNAPRYDAREVARARARFERAVLVLGSATPSLESWHRAMRGRLVRLDLKARVGGGKFPETMIADLRQTVPVPGRPKILTDRLRAALVRVVSRKEQAILFLNRRGYATAATCRGCGESLNCEHCSITLVFHRRIGRVLCHYCGHEHPLPPNCPQCQGPFRLAGFGTERIEEEVRQFLPEASLARMDSDTMKARGAHDAVLTRFRSGAIDVLIGTQMIAKGLDFPNVTLVGIVAADSTLHLPDYRASERTFSLVAQVAGRAGRGEKSGLVVVQTSCPDHDAIRLAVRHDFQRFAALELEARKQDGYPPYGHLARVVIQARDEDLARTTARALMEHVVAAPGSSEVELLGPAPAPLSMLNGEYRHHLVAKCARRSGIRAFVAAVKSAPRPPHNVRALLDVDPFAML